MSPKVSMLWKQSAHITPLDCDGKRDGQLWYDILTASNQALELPKCGHHAIIFEFKPIGEPIMVENPQGSNHDT